MTNRINAATALQMLAGTKMRPFNRRDWAAFAGCESDRPMIGRREHITGFDDKGDFVVVMFTVILDGHQLLIVEDGDISGGEQFNLTANY